MDNSKTIPWARLVAESTAIVLSILVAFSLDAWWAERQDRQTERDDLARLHTEFVWNRDRVNDNQTATRAQVASAEMYGLVNAHLGHDEPLEVRNELIDGVGATPTFDAVTPVLNGLINSGRLENIRNQEVLLAISFWQRNLLQVAETEISARQFVVTQLLPALVRRGNMGPAFVDSDPFGNTGPDGVTTVMVDEELVGLVAHRAGNTAFVMHTLDELKVAANDVVVAIEEAQND